MRQSSKIVFFGNERLSSGFEPKHAPILSALVNNGYTIAAIVVNNHDITSRSKRQLEIQAIAEKHHIPLLTPEKPANIKNQLASYKADIGVLAAYGKLVPESIMEIFPRGIVNIHPSLLPAYRGPTPVEQAILDGAKYTGVSLMQLAKEMDAGPIFAQKQVPLTGHETKADLTERLLNLGAEMLVDTLPAILDGSLQPTPQNTDKATFSKLFTKRDSHLDTAKPAYQLEREVRAHLNWPKTRATIHDQPTIVTKARVAASAEDGKLVISCGNKTYLEIQELIAPSGRTMSGADFLRGYKKADSSGS